MTLDHHRVVTRHRARGAEAGHRAQREADTPAPSPDCTTTAPSRDCAGCTCGRSDRRSSHRAAAAGAVDQAHDRQAQLVRHLLGTDLLLPNRGVRRAAAHREVVAGRDHVAPVDLAAAEDEVARREALELAVHVVTGASADGADLVERVRVEQARDALTHGELPRLALPRDLLRAAHLQRQRFAPPQLVDLCLPAHAACLQQAGGMWCHASPDLRTDRRFCSERLMPWS